jgi:hypothetical protein
LARWRWVLAFFLPAAAYWEASATSSFSSTSARCSGFPVVRYAPSRTHEQLPPCAKVAIVAARRPAVRRRGGPPQGGRVGAVSGGSRGPPPGPCDRRPPPRARAGGAQLLQIHAGKLGRRSSGEGTQRRRPPRSYRAWGWSRASPHLREAGGGPALAEPREEGEVEPPDPVGCREVPAGRSA